MPYPAIYRYPKTIESSCWSISFIPSLLVIISLSFNSHVWFFASLFQALSRRLRKDKEGLMCSWSPSFFSLVPNYQETGIGYLFTWNFHDTLISRFHVCIFRDTLISRFYENFAFWLTLISRYWVRHTLFLCQIYSTCPWSWSNLINNVQINRNETDYVPGVETESSSDEEDQTLPQNSSKWLL